MHELPGLEGRKVVVIDDEASQAAALATLLCLEGIIASCENVSTTALERISLEPPDAIVLDIKMPRLSGADLLVAARSRDPGLPAVVLTGYQANDPRVEPVLAEDRVVYLQKPVDLSQLLDALARLIADRVRRS